MNINIRDIDPQVVELLDKCVAEECFPSRASFVESLIKQYVLTRDKFYLAALPSTVRYLAKESIAEQNQAMEKSLELIYAINSKVLEELKKFNDKW